VLYVAGMLLMAYNVYRTATAKDARVYDDAPVPAAALAHA
jgi:cbb3-type cytochrome oxidase subunit 1